MYISKVLRVQWIGNWKPEFKFHPLLLAFYVAMVTSMPSLAQLSLLWNRGLPVSYIDLTHTVLCESADGHWKNVISILNMKEFWQENSHKKKLLPVYKVLVVCFVCVHMEKLFWSALCCSLWPNYNCVFSLRSVVVESKLSGQTGRCELNCHEVKCSCM